MTDEKLDELIKQMRKTNEKLDLLINIVKRSAPKPTVTKEEEKILSLCNKKNSVADMMVITKKSRGSIEFILNSIRNKGLIKSMTVKDKLVYVKM